MYTVGKKYIIIKTLSLILLFNNSGIRTHDLQVNALINRATPLRLYFWKEKRIKELYLIYWGVFSIGGTS